MRGFEMMPRAMYIHIPFCEHICHYCDFNKVFLKGQPVDEYVRALESEMAMTISETESSALTSIYVGGGTPTTLSSEQFKLLFQSIWRHFKQWSDSIEVTVEVNPGGVTERLFQMLKQLGVNRLSIGVQTFQDELLKAIGRTHTRKDVYETIKLARKVGFENLSIDLMFGLPKQSYTDFEKTIDEALSLGVEHFSAYSLQVEEKTVFSQLLRKGKLSLPDEDEEARMYDLLRDKMTSSGYQQYEISNFTKVGYESQHNLTYWNNEEYYGFGAGAHGYLDGIRYENVGPVSHYLKAVQQRLPRLHEHEVSIREQLEEEMFLGLRKAQGVSKVDFLHKYGIHLNEIFAEQLKELKENGWLTENAHFVSLTKEGMPLANHVFEQFLLDDEIVVKNNLKQ